MVWVYFFSYFTNKEFYFRTHHYNYRVQGLSELSSLEILTSHPILCLTLLSSKFQRNPSSEFFLKKKVVSFVIIGQV